MYTTKSQQRKNFDFVVDGVAIYDIFEHVLDENEWEIEEATGVRVREQRVGGRYIQCVFDRCRIAFSTPLTQVFSSIIYLVLYHYSVGGSIDFIQSESLIQVLLYTK
jgi:hypothetical protein